MAEPAAAAALWPRPRPQALQEAQVVPRGAVRLSGRQALLLAAALAGCDAGDAPADIARPGQAFEEAASPGPIEQKAADLRPGGGGLGPDLPFGSPRGAAVAAAQSRLGRPLSKDRIEECGEGPIDFVRFEGLSLNFQNDRLVGWFSRAPAKLRSESGLAAGDQASALGDAMTEETSLGAEFALADGTRGVLDEEGRTIAALWAGSACIFR